MRTEPVFEDFAARYSSGRPQLVWTKRVADLETPISAMLKLADGRANAFLLESVAGGAVRGRYSIIGLKPDVIWRCRGAKAEINRNARSDPDTFTPEEKPSLDSLRALIGESRIEVPQGLPPMASGVFGYMGYDMVRLVEKLPQTKPDKLGLHDSIFLRPTVIAIFDNVEDVIIIVTPVWPKIGLSARAAYNQAVERIGDVVHDLDRSLPQQRADLDPLLQLPEPSSNMSPDAFKGMVDKAKEYILAG